MEIVHKVEEEGEGREDSSHSTNTTENKGFVWQIAGNW